LPEKNTGLVPAHVPSAAICWRSNSENTMGHHQVGCQQHNISGALSRGSTKTSYFVIGALFGLKEKPLSPCPTFVT